MNESYTAIVDSEIANVGSVANMCKKVGYANVVVTKDCAEISAAERIILPGVGHFSRAVEKLDKLGLREILHEAVLDQMKPILGICLGMQLLCEGSDEGEGEGLSWIEGRCKKFSFNDNVSLKIPHMGWNFVESQKPQSPLSKFSTANPRFYHVHSFHIETIPENVLFTTRYGYNFTSGVQKDNIFGVQFHPEKSHVFGMELLRNFLTFASPQIEISNV